MYQEPTSSNGSLPSPAARFLNNGGERRQQQQNGRQANGGAAAATQAAAGDNRRQQNDRDDEAMEEGAGPSRRSRRAANLRDIGDIARVRDETGDRVREGFQEFLESYVALPSARLIRRRTLTFMRSSI